MVRPQNWMCAVVAPDVTGSLLWKGDHEPVRITRNLEDIVDEHTAIGRKHRDAHASATADACVHKLSGMAMP